MLQELNIEILNLFQAKHGSVPQKSAPLTPAKPETPSSARKSKKTPKKTPGKLRTPKLSTNRENSSSVKKVDTNRGVLLLELM